MSVTSTVEQYEIQYDVVGGQRASSVVYIRMRHSVCDDCPNGLLQYYIIIIFCSTSITCASSSLSPSRTASSTASSTARSALARPAQVLFVALRWKCTICQTLFFLFHTRVSSVWRVWAQSFLHRGRNDGSKTLEGVAAPRDSNGGLGIVTDQCIG